MVVSINLQYASMELTHAFMKPFVVNDAMKPPRTHSQPCRPPSCFFSSGVFAVDIFSTVSLLLDSTSCALAAIFAFLEDYKEIEEKNLNSSILGEASEFTSKPLGKHLSSYSHETEFEGTCIGS